MYIVTFDTDWVPQFVMDHTLSLLNEYGVSATCFCTGRYSFPVEGVVEAALHPNFMPDSTQGESAEKVLQTLKADWPDAIGSRSHNLFWHSGLLKKLVDHKIRYDCSALLPLCPIPKLADSGSLLHGSIWWSDNQHMIHGKSMDEFNLPTMASDGLKILLFHPIHIYLNTNNKEKYRLNKGIFSDLAHAFPEDLAPFRQGGLGVETFFKTVLNHIATTQETTKTLKQIVEEHEILT